MREVESKEYEKQAIIEQNLNLMRNEMQALLLSESMGGSAGSITIEGRNYACVRANGYVNEQGQIKAFGNFQNIPPEIKSSNKAFSFEAAVIMEKGFVITEIIEKGPLNPDALEILSTCKDLYNQGL